MEKKKLNGFSADKELSITFWLVKIPFIQKNRKMSCLMTMLNVCLPTQVAGF